VDRSEVTELHSIQPIRTVPSILQLGILSHVRAARVDHDDIAMGEIQAVRAAKSVPGPGGRPLHEYANLYFHARNPMMSKRRSQHAEICVVRVDPAVLDSPGAIVTDQNAASDYARFAPAATGLAIVDVHATMARDWRDPNQIAYWRKKSRKLAEVLVPNLIQPSLIMGAYVSGDVGRAALSQAAGVLPLVVEPDLFFAADEGEV